MADRFGKYFTNVLSGTKDKQAPGHSNNAAERHQREVFLLDDGGATAIGTTLCIGSLRGGDVPRMFEVIGSVSLAAVSVSIGTKAAPTKYVNAQALLGANVMAQFHIIDAAVLEATEELYMTTSAAALPTTAGAKMQVRSVYTHK